MSEGLLGVLIGAGVTLLVTFAAWGREDRYRFAQDKLHLFTTLMLEAEAYRNAIYWQLKAQESAVERGKVAGSVTLPDARSGSDVERVRRAIELLADEDLDQTAEDLFRRTNALGRHAYKAPPDGTPISAPDMTAWVGDDDQYMLAYYAFLSAAKHDLEVERKSWIGRQISKVHRPGS